MKNFFKMAATCETEANQTSYSYGLLKLTVDYRIPEISQFYTAATEGLLWNPRRCRSQDYERRWEGTIVLCASYG